jgi:hypothetical protein
MVIVLTLHKDGECTRSGAADAQQFLAIIWRQLSHFQCRSCRWVSSSLGLGFAGGIEIEPHAETGGGGKD